MGGDTSLGAFMRRCGALPARGALFSNRDSIFLSLLFDATCLCPFLPLLAPFVRAHAPLSLRASSWPWGEWGARYRAPSGGVANEAMGWQIFRWGGTCHPISIQSYARRLGCFCTHHSLGGRIRPPRAISKTDGRRETDKAAFERSRRDASKPFSKIYNWGHVSGQGQVKGKNRVFSGCRP